MNGIETVLGCGERHSTKSNELFQQSFTNRFSCFRCLSSHMCANFFPLLLLLFAFTSHLSHSTIGDVESQLVTAIDVFICVWV